MGWSLERDSCGCSQRQGRRQILSKCLRDEQEWGKRLEGQHLGKRIHDCRSIDENHSRGQCMPGTQVLQFDAV